VLLLTSREYPPSILLATVTLVNDGARVATEEGAALLAALEVEDTPEIGNCSEQVQGNPLALSLIAAGTQKYRPGERTIDRLWQQTNLYNWKEAPGRGQVTVSASWNGSIGRLSPALQQLLTQLSVCGEFYCIMAASLALNKQ
jgi:hypothetical protein